MSLCESSGVIPQGGFALYNHMLAVSIESNCVVPLHESSGVIPQGALLCITIC